MRLCLVIGTRPQLVKAAVLLPVLPGALFIDTGQHWDHELADDLVAELGLPRPHYSLGVASSDPERIMDPLAAVLEAEHPDLVVVVGDTNSTLAAALAAQQAGIPMAHVEAGLRTFDPSLPEERNRIAVDRIAAWRFAPIPLAVANLAREGITDGVVMTGDVMADALRRYLDRQPVRRGCYIFATIHRAANRERAAMLDWLDILASAALISPVVVALHPGTRAALAREGLRLPAGVIVSGPVGYRASLSLQLHARTVVTDSGGIERESAWLGTPVVVLRKRTEWPDLGERSVHVGLDRTLAMDAIMSAHRHPEVVPVGAARRIGDALASIARMAA